MQIEGSKPTLILKTPEEFILSMKRKRNILQKISNLSFWKKRYGNLNFEQVLKSKNFNSWQKIPLSSPLDFNYEAIKLRLLDSQKLFRRRPLNFVLINPGSVNDYIQINFLTGRKKKLTRSVNSWRIQIAKSYSVSLRRTLFAIVSKHPKTLILNSAKLNRTLKPALDELQISTIYMAPRDLQNFSNSLYDIRMKNVKHIFLTSRFLNKYEMRYAIELFGARIRIQHPSIISGLFRQCRFAQKKYGLNASHPKKEYIVELFKINKSGWGEIVVTKTSPYEIAYIRYRTELLGKAIFDKCECGTEWTIIPLTIKKPSSTLKINSDFSINISQ